MGLCIPNPLYLGTCACMGLSIPNPVYQYVFAMSPPRAGPDNYLKIR